MMALIIGLGFLVAVWLGVGTVRPLTTHDGLLLVGIALLTAGASEIIGRKP